MTILFTEFVALGSSLCHFHLLEVPWRGCTGNGVVGHQGYCGKLAWHGACGLNRQPASPEEAYIPWLWRRVLDAKEQAGLGWAGDWWLIHLAAVLEGHEPPLLSPNYGMGRCQLSFIYSRWCKFSQIMEYNLQEKNNFPGTINFNKDAFFFSWRLT